MNVGSRLDLRAAVPLPAGGCIVGRRCSTATHPINAQCSRYQPANGGQEGERLIGLPGATVGAAQAQAAPVKRVAAAVAQPVHEEGKGDEPAEGEDEIDGPMDEGAREGEQPDDGQQDGQGSDDLDEDEAAQGPRGLAMLRVQIVARDAGDDGGERELRGKAQ